MLLLALALLCLPAAGMAQELNGLFSAAVGGISDGLEESARMAIEGMEQELTLELSPEAERIEQGRALRLTITAGNPRPQETDVSIALLLPERLSAVPDAAWQATLPAAQPDPETGALVPSVTTFTREITLAPGGDSEQTVITAEMSMGTRFYRAQAPLALCVPDVRAKAAVEGTPEGRLTPGDTFVYQIEVTNSGTAPKDAAVELILPAGITPEEPLSDGFVRRGSVLTGTVRAEAAQDAPSVQTLRLPMRVNDDALEGDQDAMRLISGVLRVDGERVALPRLQVCGAKISARLMLDSPCLAEGEETSLRVVLVNAGLAPASVHVACRLPEGLELADAAEATPGEAGDGRDGTLPAMGGDDRTLAFDVGMDAATQSDDGVIANTRVFTVRLRAQETLQNAQERLVGAALTWSVDDGETQLGEAVAMRVKQPTFLGITYSEWGGIFWASLLLLVTVVCLYAAVRRDERAEDYCCD